MKKIGLLLLSVMLAMSALAACSSNKEPALSGALTYADYIDIGASIAVEAGDVYGDLARNVIFGEPSVITQAVLIVPGSADTERTYTDFTGKRIGVITGTVSDAVTQNELRGIPSYYSAIADALEDMRRGRIDGVMADRSNALVITTQPGNGIFELVEIPAEIFTGPMGAMSMDQNVLDRFNDFLAEIKADGTLAEMRERWIENPGTDPPMPEIENPAASGTLKIVTTGSTLPFSYVGMHGELKGYSIEIALRFAAHEGLKAEFATVDVAGTIPYVVSGRADICIDAFTITEERKQSVLFSDSYYDDTLVIITLRQEVAAVGTGFDFIEWLETAIQRNLLTDNRWQMIVDGLGATMTIAVLAQLFGTVLGGLFCYILTRRNKLVRFS